MIQTRTSLYVQSNWIRSALSAICASAAALLSLYEVEHLRFDPSMVGDPLRDSPYHSIVGSEKAYDAFKHSSRLHEGHLKLVRAWPANTEANRNACLAKPSGNLTVQLCKSLSQKIIVALEPVDGQQAFTALIPIKTNTRIPIGTTIEVVDEQIKIGLDKYTLP